MSLLFLLAILAGLLPAIILLPIAVLHVYWGFGGVWPGSDTQSLARMVVGRRGIRQMPGLLPCLLAALGIGAFAILPLAMIGVVPLPLPDWIIMILLVGGTVVFLCRGLITYTGLLDGRFPEQPFFRLNRLFYSPLCLFLGVNYLLLSLVGIF